MNDMNLKSGDLSVYHYSSDSNPTPRKGSKSKTLVDAIKDPTGSNEDGHNNGTRFVGDGGQITRSPKKQLRSKVPDGFASVDYKRDLKQCNAGDSDSELWLVQVPQRFDLSALNGTLHKSLLTMNGYRRLKVKEEGLKKYYSVQTYRNADDCRKLDTVVLDRKENCACLGGKIQHMMTITETLKLPHPQANFDADHVQEKRVQMPEGLKVRFKPFGAEQPWQSSVSRKKHKKRKRHTGSEDEAASPSKKRMKTEVADKETAIPFPAQSVVSQTPRSAPRRHRKHDSTQNISGADGLLDSVRKNEPHSSAAEDATPRSHKHKKPKRVKSEHSMNLQESNHQDNLTSSHKKQKRKHKKDALDDSADVF